MTYNQLSMISHIALPSVLPIVIIMSIVQSYNIHLSMTYNQLSIVLPIVLPIVIIMSIV